MCVRSRFPICGLTLSRLKIDDIPITPVVRSGLPNTNKRSKSVRISYRIRTFGVMGVGVRTSVRPWRGSPPLHPKNKKPLPSLCHLPVPTASALAVRLSALSAHCPVCLSIPICSVCLLCPAVYWDIGEMETVAVDRRKMCVPGVALDKGCRGRFL